MKKFPQTPSQKKAIKLFKKFLEENRDDADASEIEKFKVVEHGWDDDRRPLLFIEAVVRPTWVEAHTPYWVLNSESWLLQVGPNGKVVALGYPDSFKQFAGSLTAWGFHVQHRNY